MRTHPSDPVVAVAPDYSQFDTAEDMLRDAVEWGLDEKLWELMCRFRQGIKGPNGQETKGARDEGTNGPNGQGTNGLSGDSAYFGHEFSEARMAAERMARDLVFEMASAKNRDMALDLLIHVTGIGEFGSSSLRDYARRHGCTHEWFRRQAEAMRKRLDLPRLPSQRSERVRAEYRLLNRRNGSGREERPEEQGVGFQG